MSKKLKVFLAALIVVMSIFAIFAMTTTAEEKTITISFMQAYEPTSTTTTLDKTANADGKVTVKVGEKFTLPTNANISYVGQDGYQLVWYTEDGRSFKAGESVSFTEDTKLFRAVLKEVCTVEELSEAMSTKSHGALLMTDINGGNAYINVWDQNYAILDLNGHTLSIEKNGTVMGNQRSAKIIVGKGTFKVTNPDGKVGAYAVFECKGHGSYGDNNKTIVGKNVIIDAPNFHLCKDEEGTGAVSYPWIRIYGTINVNYILARWGSGNPAPQIEFFDGCNVTITGPRLVVDHKVPTASDIYNKQSFEIRIYGGTFNLPAEAATEEFWTVDNVANKDTLTVENKDHIKIEGGTFVLPDNAVPAISSYLTDDYVRVMENFNDFVKNSRDSVTREVTYKGIRNAYRITLKKDGTFTLVDNMGTGLGGTYYASFTKTSDSNSFQTFELFEDAEKTIPLTTIICQPGSKNGLLFSTPEMRTDYALQNLTANAVTYQVVVTAKCGTNANHSFNTEQEATVEANCVHTAYANYVCSGCGYSAYFNWGDLADHTFSLAGDTKATTTSLGEKVFACSDCKDIKSYPYTIDPSSLEVTVVIRNDDGTFETKTVLASEIFGFTTSGIEGAQVYSVSSIKAPAGYSVRNVYGITIPEGIMYVKITTRNNEKYKNVEYGVTELTIEEGANVRIGNVGNLVHLKLITVEKAEVIFDKSCAYYSPNNERRSAPIETLDFSTQGATIICKNNAFKDSSVANIKLTSGTKYVFDNYSLENIKITSFVLADDIDVTFAEGVFYNCNSLKTVYIQKSIALPAKMFAQCDLLETVILTEGVTIAGNGCFSGSGNNVSVRLKVYAHNPSIYFPYETFADCEGMFLYTNAPITASNYSTYFHNDAFRNTNTYNYDSDGDGKVDAMYKYCVKDTTVTTPHNFDNNRNGKLDDGYYTGGEEVPFYTVYVGIPHEYASGRVEPTCTDKGSDGYITDCPCGVIVDGIKYDKYENTTTTYKFSSSTLVIEQGTYATTIIPALGHNFLLVTTPATCLVNGDKTDVCQRENCGVTELKETLYARGNHVMIYTMAYPDGFDKDGTRTDKCDSCDEVTTESTANALFEALGYSVGPDGFSIKAGFIISKDELNAYKQVNPDFEFGVLFVNAGTVAETESFFDGKDLNASAKGLKISVDNVKYITWNAELRGYSAAIADSLRLVIGIYTVDQNGNASVIQYADANNYTTMNKYADMTLNSVSFNEVRVAHGYEALVPPPPATGDDE